MRRSHAAGRPTARGLAPELPPDIWRVIYEQLGQTDVLRSPDVAARDIATAACLCTSARDCAGFGWAQLALIKRHPLAPVPPPEAAEVTQRWYDTAYKLHRDELSSKEITDVLTEVGPPHAWEWRRNNDKKGLPESAEVRKQWLQELLPLHMASCPLTALKAVWRNKHSIIGQTEAKKTYRLTKKDLEGLEKDTIGFMTPATVQAAARAKWHDMDGLNARKEKVKATAAKAQRTWRNRRDRENAERKDALVAALKADGVDEGDIDAILQTGPAKKFMRTFDQEMGQLAGFLGKDFGGRLDEAAEYAKVAQLMWMLDQGMNPPERLFFSHLLPPLFDFEGEGEGGYEYDGE